jgi:hypothetical protein
VTDQADRGLGLARLDLVVEAGRDLSRVIA